MSGDEVGTLRAASEVFTHANPANPAKGLEQYFVRFVKVWDYNPMFSPFNNGTQMTPMRQITADLIFWQRNKRTYFSFDTSVLISNLIAHNSLLITQKSVVSVSSVCHCLHLSKNKKKGFGCDRRKHANIQPSYNQPNANIQNHLWKQTKKRLKCFLSFT